MAVPISTAVARLLVVFHLYPVAPGTAFQFQVICKLAEVWVPDAGDEAGVQSFRHLAAYPFVLDMVFLLAEAAL